MTPMRALLSATSVAAAACGVADRAGTIEPGTRTDIVVLAASPLDDIAAVSKVLAVYKGGELVT